MKKVAIIILCSVIVVLDALSIQLWHSNLMGHKFKVDGIYYEIVNDSLNIVEVSYKGKDWKKYKNEYRGQVVIPDVVTYKNRTYTVEGIGDFAFRGCSEITSVNIPKSVHHIGFGVWIDCDDLKEIHINDLSAWCELSFCDITDYSGDSPFCYAEELYLNGELITNLVVPEDVTIIGAHAFEGYKKLRSVILHEDISAIYKSAFSGCTNLANITAPEDIHYIGPEAFHETRWYKSKPNGEIYIGNLFYKYKGKMSPNTSIVIKDGTEAICEDAFCYCDGLSSITLPSSLKCIHNCAFIGCYNLKEIYCKAPTPPYWNNSYQEYHDDVILYIPIGLKGVYGIYNWREVQEVDF